MCSGPYSVRYMYNSKLEHRQLMVELLSSVKADRMSVLDDLSGPKQWNITWLKGRSPGEEDLKLLFDVRHIFDGLEVWH